MRRAVGSFAVVAVVVAGLWVVAPTHAVTDPPPPTLAIGAVSVVEGNAGHRTASVPVTLSSPLASDLVVTYATADTTATAPGDYKAKNGKTKIGAGKTSAKASVVVNGDTTTEGDETIAVALTGADDATVVVDTVPGIVTIIDDEARPFGTAEAPTLSIGDTTRTEGPTGTTKVAVPLTLSHPVGVDLSIAVHTVDVGATAPGDYKALAKQVKLKAGKTARNVSISLYGDAADEPDESFTVELTAVTGATIGMGRASGTVTIVDDDEPPPPAVTAPGAPDAPTASLVGSDPGDLGLVAVAWAPSADDGGSPLTGYLLEVSNDGTTWSTAASVADTVTSFTHDCGLPAVTCRYRVTAANTVGDSDPSAPSSAVTTQDPSPLGETSLPLGGVHNYLGTGGLATGVANTPYENEGMWLGVSGYCTDRYQGDWIASRFYDGERENDCVGQLNPDWRDTNYEYYVELPAGRTYPTDVIIYHGNFVRNADCSGAANINTPHEFCPAGNGSKALMPTTMTLFAADATPDDDSDNPTTTIANTCNAGTGSGAKTFNPISPSTSSAESNYDFNPSPGNFTHTGSAANSGWFRLCQIPSSAPAGRYILRVRNQSTAFGAATENTGSNGFGIVATPSSPQRLCDARTDTTCPKVYAKSFLSTYVLANGTTSYFLSELGSAYAGRTIEVRLWDAGEGATELRVNKPTGTTTWTDQAVDYWSTCGPTNVPGMADTNVSAINNFGSNLPFNGCLLTISFTLPADYSPPADNPWWRVQFLYSQSATDRTTWSVSVVN